MISSWIELWGLLLKQFRATIEESLLKQWMDLRQVSSIAKYCRKFIAQVAPLEDVYEICFVSKFVSGLGLEIRKELRLLRPGGLGQAMDLSQMIEDKLSPTHLRARASGVIGGQAIKRNKNSFVEEGPSSRVIPPARNPLEGMKTEIWRLTNFKLQQRHEKGLCYHCDEKYSLGHCCKRKELSVLVLEEDEEIGEEVN